MSNTYHRNLYLQVDALDVAARAPFERMTNNETTGTAFYLFDTRALFGDYTLIEVALPFASEVTARQALLNLLRA